MNFENLINFDDFMADPTAALKKARKLMEEEIKEKIENEKRELEEKLRNQRKIAYEQALESLKQQYNQMYEELKSAAGIDKLEEQLKTEIDIEQPKPVESKPVEKKSVEVKNKKYIKASEREQRVIEHLDSVAITVIFDNTGALYSSDDVQTLLASLGYTNANELSHEEVQRLVAAVINDNFISEGYMKRFLMNGSSQLYNEGVISSYVDDAIKNYPDATIDNGIIPFEKNEDENEQANNRYNF